MRSNAMLSGALLLAAVLSTATPAVAGRLEEGVAAYRRFEFALALERLAPLASGGDAIAQGILGEMYLRGQGVRLNALLAARWLQKAAEQSDVSAQFSLGLLYFNGRGLRRDYAEAAKWFERAARQGDVSAQSHLAGLYAIGQGVRRDYVLAYAWYARAASASRNEFDETSLRELEAKMTPEQRARASRILSLDSSGSEVQSANQR